MEKFKIYAIKYAGPLTVNGSYWLWQKDWDKSRTGNFYFWCLKNKERVIIVDTGVSPDLAREKELPDYIQPDIVLSGMGIKASQVKEVIITHMHWDHFGGMEFFPQARFYVHALEYDFWTKEPVAQSAPFQLLSDKRSLEYMQQLLTDNRLVFIHEETEIFPGIKTINAPGHSPALLALAIQSARGIAVLGSDSAYGFDNFKQTWPSDVIYNLADQVRSLARLRKIAPPDLVFPGHDPALTENYPLIAPGITRLV